MDLSRSRRHVIADEGHEAFNVRASALINRLKDIKQEMRIDGDSQVIQRIAELKRVTSIVYLNCALYGLTPSDSITKTYVRKILKDIVELLAMEPSCQVVWPLFVAAVELDPLDLAIMLDPDTGKMTDGRRLVLELLMKMSKSSVSSVTRARVVIEQVWKSRDFSHSPNSTRPVLVYRNALIDKTPQGAADAIEQSEWIYGGHWIIAENTLAAVPHYHSITHEAYTVLHGTGTYRLGKSSLDPGFDANGEEVGVVFTARAGDVFVFPAGVTHCVTSTSDNYEIIGWYLLNDKNSRAQPWDYEEALDSPEETNRKRLICESVSTPVLDPVYGKEGHLPIVWKRD
ncbi:transcriptional regulator family: Fungal Specific TF [Aspergillus niger]|nr:transcriptional regulator family: Fungal Specific TF [Aspergillus niger]KAI3022162.1 transcriptional regulator family: Fungal Specific TF [Aspergillus niger]KAI3059074.1 transcriptional regulator family: Fungal Specific TF [Aspergillus niger]